MYEDLTQFLECRRKSLNVSFFYYMFIQHLFEQLCYINIFFMNELIS